MNKKVFVALSGGVDSSVALALLKEQGYEVTGVYFKTYKPDGNREYCETQGKDAQKVCKHLDIPFKVFDLEEEYKQKVFDYMIGEYKAGRTPNPDIICNKHIKFGVFLQKALADGADIIATGHYSRLRRQFQISNFKFQIKLLKAIDHNKDQSYFLSQLTQKQLSCVMFPLGELTKPEVRKLAKKFGLHTADKKDSQGICFIGHEMHTKDFLKQHIKEKPGDVLNTKGKKIGTHSGAVFYTIGERHDFTVDPKHQTPNMPRLFVIEKDLNKNTLTIGTHEELKQHQSKALVLKIEDANWINESPEEGREYKCRIRHRGELYSCTIYKNKITFKEPPYATASGQFVAVYDDDECLGGGAIM